jgi:hypothetical protein
MPPSDPEAIVRQFLDSAVDGPPGTSLAELRQAVPDLWVTVEDAVTTGGTVVVRWSATGTLRLWPLPGMELDVRDLVHVFTVADGRVTAVHELGPRRDPGEDEGEDDDDGRGGSPAPPGPRWVPPKPPPKPRPKQQQKPQDNGGRTSTQPRG